MQGLLGSRRSLASLHDRCRPLVDLGFGRHARDVTGSTWPPKTVVPVLWLATGPRPADTVVQQRTYPTGTIVWTLPTVFGQARRLAYCHWLSWLVAALTSATVLNALCRFCHHSAFGGLLLPRPSGAVWPEDTTPYGGRTDLRQST
jgi:hypothetical protein